MKFTNVYKLTKLFVVTDRLSKSDNKIWDTTWKLSLRETSYFGSDKRKLLPLIVWAGPKKSKKIWVNVIFS